MNHLSIRQRLVELADAQDKRIADIVIAQQVTEQHASVDELYQHMADTFHVMQESVEWGLQPAIVHPSGLSGGCLKAFSSA